ncbi:MAG: hypothetical protein V5A46_01665 [Haloferacaceae archaeon]
MASEYEPRIRQLASEARSARDRALEEDSRDGAPESTDDAPKECATEAARDGLGSVVALYVEAKTGEEDVRLSAAELSLLHRATNDWLAVYAACYDVEFDPDYTVREAAQLLVDTHDIRETAALLTQLPERSSRT